ncbi:MAG: copper amine oxidase N-terminal domain-containing protein [Clostridiales bacterium]|jgi:hypothetical protein|nr:copper amine oxidase N-terminal domain-containing protein [Clostridiales bacterium]
MKKLKRFGAAILGLVVALVAVPALAFPAAEDSAWDMPPVDAEFLSFEGVIVEITEFDERIYIRAQNAEGSVMVFVKDFTTFVLGEGLAAGDNIVGYFDANAPAIMIYPPQHPARVIVNGNHGEIQVGRIAEGLEIGDKPVYLQDGQNVREIVAEPDSWVASVEEFIAGRLLVISDDAIYVLFEIAVPLPGFGLGLGLDLGLDLGLEQIEWAYNYGISVEGRMVDALWQEIDGGFYVPFRAVVNLLRFGQSVAWEHETRSITVSNGTDTIAFALNSNEFRVGERVVTLEHPAILIEDTTYVPFNFFSQVFGMNNAYMHEGKIIIDNEETMQ